MPGLLFVVATPIGNLEDITLRGLRILREADLIAAEDTRRTARLLARHGIAAPTTSLHEHNEATKIPALIARLRSNAKIALVSDAGTPGVSDPGMRLIRAAIAEGIAVTPIPGPSAVLTALIGAGRPFEAFKFLGFPPPRSKDLFGWFSPLVSETQPVVFFEAPHRILATLRTALMLLGDRPIVIGREMTKAHEEWLRGSISTVINKLAQPRGEFTVVLFPAESSQKSTKDKPNGRAIYVEFCQLTEHEAISRRLAVSTLARRHGMSSREVYQAVEEQKKLVE